MTRISYARALDDVLRTRGFERAGDDWTRVRGDMWECVNRQSGLTGGVTINLLMKDLETEKLYLEVFGYRGAYQMPPTSIRIGALIDGYDHWWGKDELDGASDLARAVLDYGLPWFDRVRSPLEQAENWYGRDEALTDRGYHWPSLVKLALTLYRMGEVAEACEVLRKPAPKTSPATAAESVAKVREWLGCDPRGEAPPG